MQTTLTSIPFPTMLPYRSLLDYFVDKLKYPRTHVVRVCLQKQKKGLISMEEFLTDLDKLQSPSEENTTLSDTIEKIAAEMVQSNKAEIENEQDVIGEHLCCAITREIMVDPVLADDGFTYERQAIEAWIKAAKNGGKQLTSPMTRQKMTDKLVPNRALKAVIDSLRTKKK
jgi:hypothetical protein